MRPLKLELHNFGSYQHESIVFDELGERGIYLICGNTGAGKTTLFDAICYALFGVCSGSHKKPEMLRCQQAQDAEPTWVSLSFTHQGENYSIKRSLPYSYINEKGREVNKKNRIELETPTETITKVAQARAKIFDILGLDAVQFKQIALIAQNQFLDLIHARSEDRNKIFRDLFDTQKYLAFQKKLTETWKEENQLFQSLLAGQKQCEEQLCTFLALDCSEAITKSVVLEKIEHKQQEIQSDRKKLDQDKIQLEKELQDKNRQQGILQNRQSLVQKYQRAKNALLTARKEQQEMDKKQADLESRLPEIVQAQNDYTLLNNSLKSYESLEAARRKVKKSQKQLDQTESELQKKEEALASLSQQKEANVKKIAQKTEVDLKLAGLTARLDKAKELNDKKQLLAQKKKDQSRLQTKYEKQRESYAKAAEKYQKARISFMDNLAGVLRKDLKQGDLCPVCHHLIEAEDVLDQEEEPVVIDSKALERLEKDQQKKEHEAQKTSSDLSSLQIEIDHLKEMMESLEKETENKDLKALEQERDGLLKEKEQIETAQKEQQDLIKDMDSQQNELKILQEKRETCSKEISSLQGSIAQLENELSYPSKAKAVAEINRLAKIMNDYFDQEKKLKKDLEACKKKLMENEGFCKAHSELEGKDFAGEIAVLKTEIETLSKRSKELDDKGKKLLIEEKELGDLQKDYQKILAEIEEKGAHIMELEELCQAVNGNLKGNKIKLETYLQQYYFDQILLEANAILDEISNHRYALIRKEITNGKAMQGLDLAIEDAFGSESREIKSLSGGESFKAALSLALGLSQSVSMQSGGFCCESLFIDEGFGNLDQANLEETIETLKTMAGSQKLVAIISHLPSLQDQIEKKLEVSYSTTKGSKVKVSL